MYNVCLVKSEKCLKNKKYRLKNKICLFYVFFLTPVYLYIYLGISSKSTSISVFGILAYTILNGYTMNIILVYIILDGRVYKKVKKKKTNT